LSHYSQVFKDVQGVLQSESFWGVDHVEVLLYFREERKGAHLSADLAKLPREASKSVLIEALNVHAKETPSFIERILLVAAFLKLAPTQQFGRLVTRNFLNAEELIPAFTSLATHRAEAISKILLEIPVLQWSLFIQGLTYWGRISPRALCFLLLGFYFDHHWETKEVEWNTVTLSYFVELIPESELPQARKAIIGFMKHNSLGLGGSLRFMTLLYFVLLRELSPLSQWVPMHLMLVDQIRAVNLQSQVESADVINLIRNLNNVMLTRYFMLRLKESPGSLQAFAFCKLILGRVPQNICQGITSFFYGDELYPSLLTATRDHQRLGKYFERLAIDLITRTTTQTQDKWSQRRRLASGEAVGKTSTLNSEGDLDLQPHLLASSCALEACEYYLTENMYKSANKARLLGKRISLALRKCMKIIEPQDLPL
jgi:hypothetical protein